MYFFSFSDFIHMGGHGLYVWSSYGIAMLVVLWNVAMPLLKRGTVLASLRQRLIRERSHESQA